MSPNRRRVIILTNAALLSIGPWGTNLSEILIEIQNFSFTKMHLKIPSAKWPPFWPWGDELMYEPCTRNKLCSFETSIPAGTRRNNNVFISSKRRRRRRFDVMKTISLRHYCVMCPLGIDIKAGHLARKPPQRSRVIRCTCNDTLYKLTNALKRSIVKDSYLLE